MLVVEDEPIIRLGTIQIVEDAGYQAIGARDAAHALRILESRGDICAVFTEIRVPGSVNGMVLARTIHGRWPLISLILTSSAAITTDDNFPANWRYVRKPYFGAQVAAALHEIVN